MKINNFKNYEPTIGENVYLQDGVKIEGKVFLADNVNIWYNATLRGDVCSISIGENTNVQELSSIHGDYNFDVKIGSNVTVGHNCIIHGATIGNDVLIGMGAILLNGSIVPDNCLVAAGSLVTHKLVCEPGMMIMGNPATATRPLKDTELKYIKDNALEYLNLAKEHQE